MWEIISCLEEIWLTLICVQKSREISRFPFNQSLIRTSFLCLLPKHCMQSSIHRPLKLMYCIMHYNRWHFMWPTCTQCGWDESDFSVCGCRTCYILKLMHIFEVGGGLMLKFSFRSSGKIYTCFKEELISLETLILRLLLRESFQSRSDVKVRSAGSGQKGFLAMPVRES